MKHIFREYFTYTSRERNGVLALLAVIVMLLVLLGISDRFVTSQQFDFTSFKNEVAAYEQSQQEEQDEKQYIDVSYSHAPGKSERFLFDPNTATEDDLKRLGLTPKQVHAVMSFRKNGGFSDKEEFAKIKSIPPDLYASLEPYILLPNRDESTGIFTKPEKPVIEINSADSIDLVQAEEIGESLAKRILRFRNALGGFISLQQLLEVKGVDEKRLARIASRISIDSAAIKKIDINACTIEQLSWHPYVSYNQARAIVNYRTVHGNFKKVSDIRSCDLVNDELYNKIVPYLVVE